jgi:hypothetical protein
MNESNGAVVNTHGFDVTTGLHTNPGDTWRSQEQLMARDVVDRGLAPARIRWYSNRKRLIAKSPAGSFRGHRSRPYEADV